MSNPKVAIVIVNWNKKDFILNLLKSLEELNYDNYEIIVVDNASTDGSAEAIREAFPYVTLIINKENLGGTGGFNTGMRYAIENKDCKYIWLLDNDAEIEKDTLVALVNTMETDEQIGIAGSRLVCKDTKITLECGAYVNRNSIGVTPCFRNLKMIPSSKLVEADYVAACSALVRTKALSTVGLMDERFFLHWDDMDWGLTFKNKGYKVVAVPNSVVYHPSFTEIDRGLITHLYYDVRNPLLTYAKQFKGISLMKPSYNYFRYFFEGTIFLYLSGDKGKVLILVNALKDFFKERWGSFSRWHTFKKVVKKDDGTKQDIKDLIGGTSKILIIGLNATKGELRELRNKFGDLTQEITLLIQDDRTEYYRDDFRIVIPYNKEKGTSLIYNILLFANLFFSGYDISVSTGYNPFLLTAKKRYTYTEHSFVEIAHKVNFFTLIASTLLGEVCALVLTPLFLWKSRKLRRET